MKRAPLLQSLESGQCCVGHIDLTIRLIGMLIRGYCHGYGFHYKGGSDSHVPVVLHDCTFSSSQMPHVYRLAVHVTI